GHGPVTVRSVAEELEADRAATEWLLDGVSQEATIIDRGLAVAIGVIALAALDSEYDRHPAMGRRTHPTGAERVHAALGHPAFGADHVVFKFAGFALKAYLDNREIPVPCNEYDTARDMLNDYCLALHRASQ